MSRVALFLLGPPRIERDGEPVELDTRKAMALASYLAVTGESHSRDSLTVIFWPLSNEVRGRAVLRRTLSTLRKAFSDGKLESGAERLVLRPGADFWLDVDQFLRLLARCKTHGHPPEDVCPVCLAPLTEAVTLYRADFMTGFTLRDSPTFDEWQSFQAESLRLELARALEKLVQCHCDRREFEPAIAYARRWVALDSMHIKPHYLLMQMFTWTGQRSAALRQYQEYTQILEQELGVPPEEDITQLYQSIRDNRVPPLPPRATPLPSHNLPLQPTPFVGRETELLEIGQLIDGTACRMLTLSGPGGIGKTRLALEAAAQRIAAFPDGVYFVPLAHLGSADLLVAAIAEALKFPFRGSANPKDQLLNYLREKEMLLLLDNFEHLLDEVAIRLLIEILSSAAYVKVLVTSRERLNLLWEWPIEVGGLQFPEGDETVAAEEYSAIKLFLQSARRAHPGFALTETEKPFVVRICQSLEGMPLGIELAAAWVEVSSCQHIAQQIERNLNILATSRRDVPERHSSLQAAFEHSWELISTEERNVLTQLSVFRSGFRRAAAVQVAGASLLYLSALMHKSFLRRSPTGRYVMLEVLRQYGEEKLQGFPQAWDDAHERHCQYYAEFLHQREELLKGEELQQALEEIGEEIDNVRAAWRWAVSHCRREQLEKSLESLQRFYEMRSWFLEAEAAFGQATRALAGDQDVVVPPGGQTAAQLLAKVRARQGWFCLKLSRFEEGRELLQASLATLQHLETPGETALALNYLGSATAMLGDFDEAAQLFRDSIAIYKSIGDLTGMANGLNNIGIVAMIQRRHQDARLLLLESLAIREESGSLSRMRESIANLGLVAETMGEYEEARRFHQQDLAICIELGDQWGIANSLCNLAFSFSALGENLAARICFQESLETALDLQAVDLILEDLIGIATLLAQQGKEEQAVELASCVRSHPAIAGKAQERGEQLLAELESRLSPQAFIVAQRRGKTKDIQHYARVHTVSRPAW